MRCPVFGSKYESGRGLSKVVAPVKAGTTTSVIAGDHHRVSFARISMAQPILFTSVPESAFAYTPSE